MSLDAAVQATADEALQSKLTAAQLGYIHDPYLQFFVHHGPKKPPLINRGYWARVHRVQKTISDLMELEDPLVQVVSLGAGLDTSYWIWRNTARRFKYIEVDFLNVMERKLRTVAAHSELAVEGTRLEDAFVSSDYCFLASDLRDADSLLKKLKTYCDVLAPTLFLAECVLVYLDGPSADNLIQMAGAFDKSAFLSYDMINPDDPFGRMMVSNITSRGIRLPGLSSYPSLASQHSRFSRFFPSVSALTMLEVYRSAVDPAERRRIEGLEWLDEIEEWELISGHYCLVLGVKGLSLAL